MSDIDYFTTIITAISVVVAGIAIKIQQYYQKKQYQMDGLVKAFEILGGDEHRKARDRIRESFIKFKPDGDEKFFEGKGLKTIVTKSAGISIK